MGPIAGGRHLTVLVSKSNRALLVPRFGAAINMFPVAHKLTHLDQEHLVLPHDLPTFRLLQNIGLRVPHPILSYYDWRGGRPFDVQRATCAMLTANPRAYVLNAMGTGKTKSALWAWDYLHGNKLAGKLLVVAPLSTLNFTWAREVFATLPDVRVMVLGGVGMSKAARLARLEQDADIYVINHDGLKVIHNELTARTDIDTLILDELAVYRNNSQRSKHMRAFARRFQTVWGMTGAPMPQEPTDVWGQCMIVTPWTVPKQRTHTRDLLMYKAGNFLWKPKRDAVENAFKMMQPSVRFALDDVVELPEVIYRNIDVPLTPEQDRVYKALVNDFRAQVANKTVNAMNAAAAMSKLLQVSSGWVYAGAQGTANVGAQPRLDALQDLIESAEHKVIVFVPYRHAIEGVSEFLNANKIDHAVVHGDVSDRETIFNAFQNSSTYKVLVAHPGCISHGLTLTAADTVIWWGPIASLETYEQANARITRVGQLHKQQVLHLQATPVEKRIYSLLRSKKKVQDQLLDLFETASEGMLDAA